MSAEERSTHALCGARKRDGGTCRLFAGQGTEHKGVGRCKLHGGSTRSHRANAIKVEAQQRTAEFGEPIEVEPTEALLYVLQLSFGHLFWVRAELAAHDDKTTHAAQVLARIYDDERDRVARISKAALDAGVAERHVQFVERCGAQLAELMRAVLFDSELGLTKAQHAHAPAVLRRHFAVIDAKPRGALTA